MGQAPALGFGVHTNLLLHLLHSISEVEIFYMRITGWKYAMLAYTFPYNLVMLTLKIAAWYIVVFYTLGGFSKNWNAARDNV